jgi:uncharacterized SAM-binding protein YcdF (DUF218 family)
MFLVKKFLSRILFPVPLCLELLVAGLLLLWFTKRQRTGKTLITLGVILLASLSHSSVADRLLGPLESKYPAWAATAEMSDDSSRPDRADHRPKSVVVLGGGYSPDPRRPVTGRLSDAALARLVEGIRVHRELPGAKLLLCVGAQAKSDDEGEQMTQLAATLGAKPADVSLIRGARDTEEEMEAIHGVVGDEPIVLVTSASHMPRAMDLAQAQGLNPTAAPTDYRAERKQWDHPSDFFPDAEGLRGSERAVYEYLGRAWTKLRTWL